MFKYSSMFTLCFYFMTWTVISLYVGKTQCFYLRFLPLHLGKDKYFFHYIWENIHKIGKNKAIFGLGMPPVTGGKTGQIKSLKPFSLFDILFYFMTYVEWMRFCERQ